ncbi:MAG: hypothetical protein O2816_13755 [Planctomycetota bacterium]|nr:hypothetical protein [Planctomycetota bacterium]
MHLDLPFGVRVGLALAFLACVSMIELARRGREAVRWRLSLVLVGCALLGAGFGIAVDSITVRLSPDYFAWGKALGDGPGLTGRALRLGSMAGGSAGVTYGAILIVAARGRAVSAPLRHAWSIPCLAALGGLAGGLLAPWLRTVPDEAPFLDPSREGQALLRVWCAHSGVYLGSLLGLVWAIRNVRKSPPINKEGRIGVPE